MAWRCIEVTPGACGVSDADFADTRADRLHRLPVVRIKATLNPVDLETRLPTRSIRE